MHKVINFSLIVGVLLACSSCRKKSPVDVEVDLMLEKKDILLHHDVFIDWRCETLGMNSFEIEEKLKGKKIAIVLMGMFDIYRNGSELVLTYTDYDLMYKIYLDKTMANNICKLSKVWILIVKPINVKSIDFECIPVKEKDTTEVSISSGRMRILYGTLVSAVSTKMELLEAMKY